MASIQKITSNLWFDNQAEEAVNFYTSIFKDSKINTVLHYGKAGHDIHKMPEGSIMIIEFELNGHAFTALNAGPIFKFNEAISFVINCNDQEEIDYYWSKLSEGGDESAQVCGWLKDKYGLSWQVVPVIMQEMMKDKDRSKADRVMDAMMQMKKLNIQKLKAAYESPN